MLDYLWHDGSLDLDKSYGWKILWYLCLPLILLLILTVGVVCILVSMDEPTHCSKKYFNKVHYTNGRRIIEREINDFYVPSYGFLLKTKLNI